VREDFVEIIANYLVKSEAQWDSILVMASKNGLDYQNKPLPDDGIDGKAVIKQKLEIAKKWLHDAWNIDIVALRNEIINRQKNISEVI